MSEKSEKLAETLEALVDKHGLAEVLAALSDVCMDKAEHLRVNWQDVRSARRYDEASDRLYPAYDHAKDWKL